MCWIVWVFDLNRNSDIDLPWETLKLLRWNKNRGQEWYGISVLTEKWDVTTYKFKDIYDVNIYQELSWIKDKIIWIIGHARYPTSWSKWGWDDYIQPFEMKELPSGMAFAFNWNLPEPYELVEYLQKEKFVRIPEPILDTKVLERLILEEAKAWETNTTRISENIHNRIDGSCNMILMADDWSFTLSKDRWWFRPLSFVEDIKKNNKTKKEERVFYFSSESRALFKIWFDEEEIETVNTWEAIRYNPQSKQLIQSKMNLDVPMEKSRCFFETVYFADPKTKLWNSTSNTHRYRLWQELAKSDINTFDRDKTFVIHIPDSSRDSAQWYADLLNLHHLDAAVMRNPYAGRTFIADDESRWKKVEEKYILNPALKSLLKWNRLIVVDDSIVRGTTQNFIVKKLIDFYKPSEVDIRIPSPPVVWPCYYAINLKHPSELIARKFFTNPTEPTEQELQKLAEYFSANSIKYINKEWLIRALRVDVKDMCLGCIDGRYPTTKWIEIFKRQLIEKITPA